MQPRPQCAAAALDQQQQRNERDPGQPGRCPRVRSTVPRAAPRPVPAEPPPSARTASGRRPGAPRQLPLGWIQVSSPQRRFRVGSLRLGDRAARQWSDAHPVDGVRALAHRREEGLEVRSDELGDELLGARLVGAGEHLDLEAAGRRGRRRCGGALWWRGRRRLTGSGGGLAAHRLGRRGGLLARSRLGLGATGGARRGVRRGGVARVRLGFVLRLGERRSASGEEPELVVGRLGGRDLLDPGLRVAPDPDAGEEGREDAAEQDAEGGQHLAVGQGDLVVGVVVLAHVSLPSCSPAYFSMDRISGLTRSIGSGKRMVELRSVAMSESVCR